MDQVKIGKFIAECRKKNNLTQIQLVEKLNITDRAISKWENGKATPDSSIMLDLCKELKINVNELLSGEVIDMNKYDSNAEKNFIESTKEAEKREANIKKKIRRILQIVFLLIILTVVIVLINTYSKYLIIKDLQEKFEEYASSENYYMKSSEAWGDGGEYSITKCYVKDEKIFELKENSDSQENKSTQATYQNGEKYNIYYEYGNIKQAEINVEGTAPIAPIYNFLESESNFETFTATLWADIDTLEYDGEEYYIVSNYVTSITIGGSETT